MKEAFIIYCVFQAMIHIGLALALIRLERYV